MSGGVVLKYNGNQRYATNSVTASILRDACKIAGVTVQVSPIHNKVTSTNSITEHHKLPSPRTFW